ncbi:MAG: alpha/beta hydrolase [Methylobacteriaceae bacterium]|nr:alpha/beta hydrolase [Methylobacteriaceae bacterium]
MSVGTAGDERQIAFLKVPEGGKSAALPGLVWLGGFKSDMRSTKASALLAWAEAAGHSALALDYSGHGESSGTFEDGTIGRWFEEALAVFRAESVGPQIVLGSSMGGWIALLLARALAKAGEQNRLHGFVLIAPAVDFTAHMWEGLPAKVRRTIETEGKWLRPSKYSPEPYPITRQLIEEGKNHLLLGGTIRTHAPVHILQGMQDADVPWKRATTLIEHLAGDPAVLTLVKDGDHRLSREEDLQRLFAAIEAMG